MTNYVVSPKARQSLKEIKEISDYTLQNFGERQRRKYLTLLRDCMRDAAGDPSRGRPRDDIKSGYYSTSVGKHYIYYRINSDGIDIIDVLHHSMDPIRHL